MSFFSLDCQECSGNAEGNQTTDNYQLKLGNILTHILCKHFPINWNLYLFDLILSLESANGHPDHGQPFSGINEISFVFLKVKNLNCPMKDAFAKLIDKFRFDLPMILQKNITIK